MSAPDRDLRHTVSDLSTLRLSLYDLLDKTKWTSKPLFVAVILLVILQRGILSDIQLNWDEEWYFQIARSWKQGIIPYRDIFDHKPPLVYVFYMLTTWGTHIIAARMTVTGLLIGSIVLMFGALRRSGLVSEWQFLVFSAVLCCFLSSQPSGASSNTEMIYAPFIFLSFGLLLDGKVHASAVCAALAVGFKYSVIIEIVGIGILYWMIAPRRNERNGVLLTWCAGVLILSAGIYLAFYVYFLQHGVDLIKQIIGVNLRHVSSDALPILGPDSGFRDFLTVSAEAGVALCAVCALKRPDGQLLKGSLAWMLLSLIQGCLTRQYYQHYFLPSYAPLTLAWASFRVRETLVPLLMLGMIVLECQRIDEGYRWLTQYRGTTSQYLAVCDAINGRGYIMTEFLAGYRVCNTKSVDKFGFPPFYLAEHFAAVSNSGGLAALRSKLRRGEITSIIATGAQLEEFRTVIGLDEARVRIVPNGELTE